VLQAFNVDQAPKAIKLLINRPSLGFEDVYDAGEPEVSQILQLSPEDVEDGNRIPLRFVRFQVVNSLHVSTIHRFMLSVRLHICHFQIFISSNQGGKDETRIDVLDIFGVPLE
jgi:hypothetical protein